MSVYSVFSASSITLLKNANVYAPDSIGLKHLVIGGGEILYIGDVLPVLDSLLAVDELDLQGQALIPGFIDAHTHITGGGGEAGFSTRVPAVPLSQFTKAGATTAAGLSGTDDITRSTDFLLYTSDVADD